VARRSDARGVENALEAFAERMGKPAAREPNRFGLGYYPPIWPTASPADDYSVHHRPEITVENESRYAVATYRILSRRRGKSGGFSEAINSAKRVMLPESSLPVSTNRSQDFIGADNATLSVIAVCVSNPDCSPLKVHP